jgi:hypothetical protein
VPAWHVQGSGFDPKHYNKKEPTSLLRGIPVVLALGDLKRRDSQTGAFRGYSVGHLEVQKKADVWDQPLPPGCG